MMQQFLFLFVAIVAAICGEEYNNLRQELQGGFAFPKPSDVGPIDINKYMGTWYQVYTSIIPLNTFELNGKNFLAHVFLAVSHIHHNCNCLIIPNCGKSFLQCGQVHTPASKFGSSRWSYFWHRQLSSKRFTARRSYLCDGCCNKSIDPATNASKRTIFRENRYQ